MAAVSDENRRDDLSEVFRLLGDAAGMAPDALGVAAMTHAVRKHMAARDIASPRAYCALLAADPPALDEVVEELLVPETWFFRDAMAFACLARRLGGQRPMGLPSWASRRPLRVLSVACSTGEEVYSLAIALRESGVAPGDCRVLGVDLSRAALAVAAAGRYSARSFREAGPAAVARRDHWCRPIDADWQVVDALREMVEFRRANFAQRDFLADESPWDVIFCRNVLIYFRDDARAVALENLRRLLSAGGLLCSAPAEARLLSEAGFARAGGECPFAFTHPAAPGGTLSADSGATPRRTDAGPKSRPRSPATASLHPRTAARGGAINGRFINGSAANGDAANGVSSPRAPRPSVASESTRPPSAPSSQAAMLRAAEEAADSGRFEEADALCGRILAEDLTCVEAHYLRGVLRQAQGQLQEAHRSWEKSLYLDPRHYRSLVHMMLLAEQRKDRAAAANYRLRIEQLVAGDLP